MLIRVGISYCGFVYSYRKPSSNSNDINTHLPWLVLSPQVHSSHSKQPINAKALQQVAKNYKSLLSLLNALWSCMSIEI